MNNNIRLCAKNITCLSCKYQQDGTTHRKSCVIKWRRFIKFLSGSVSSLRKLKRIRVLDSGLYGFFVSCTQNCKVPRLSTDIINFLTKSGSVDRHAFCYKWRVNEHSEIYNFWSRTRMAKYKNNAVREEESTSSHF